MAETISNIFDIYDENNGIWSAISFRHPLSLVQDP